MKSDQIVQTYLKNDELAKFKKIYGTHQRSSNEMILSNRSVGNTYPESQIARRKKFDSL